MAISFHGSGAGTRSSCDGTGQPGRDRPEPGQGPGGRPDRSPLPRRSRPHPGQERQAPHGHGGRLRPHPLFAHDRLGIDTYGFGLLLTAEASGGLLGAGIASYLGRRFGTGSALTCTAAVERPSRRLTTPALSYAMRHSEKVVDSLRDVSPQFRCPLWQRLPLTRRPRIFADRPCVPGEWPRRARGKQSGDNSRRQPAPVSSWMPSRVAPGPAGTSVLNLRNASAPRPPSGHTASGSGGLQGLLGEHQHSRWRRD